MTRYILSLAAILAIAFAADGQTTILERSVKQIGQYRNFSYQQELIQIGPFGDEPTKLNITWDIEQLTPAGTELFRRVDARGYTTIGNGSTKIELDLNEKTYSVNTQAKEEQQDSPYYWAKFMQEQLENHPDKIKQLADTLIKTTSAYHIQIKLVDTINSRSIYDLCLDKKTLLPVYTKRLLHGAFGKGDISSTVLATMVNEDWYSNYRINAKNFPDLADYKIPMEFKPEKRATMLATGTKVPDWSLQDMNGKNYSEASFKGKVLLIDMFFINCGACALSQPVLAKLHEKYKGSDLQILSMNTSDAKDAVKRYIAKNNIKYPILLNAATTAKKFQVPAYPTFYLVDKEGKIAAAIEGYSDEFEADVTAQIDKALGR